jgi:hypothetical protein
MSTSHWSDDPTADLDWNNFSRGWDVGYNAAKAGDHSTDLTGHGEPFCDGFCEGWEMGQQR